MSNVRLENVYKIYPNGVKAVKDFNLNIENEEFIVFVGPSGCGKSTTLRMIAGLEDISAGRVYIDDVLVNDMEPKDRDISMVFQNYALYPNMSVYDNMAYGLRCQNFPTEADRVSVTLLECDFSDVNSDIKDMALPTRGEYFGNVSITWSIKGESKTTTILDNKITITQGDMDEDVTIIAKAFKNDLGNDGLSDAIEEEKEITFKVYKKGSKSNIEAKPTIKGANLSGRKLKEALIEDKIQRAAEILGITPYLNRKPKELSGGQRQRVALGRAIVRKPKVFLLDEPLSNLDAKLRVQMRSEITKLHEQLGTTFIYVTHDQIEAMTMGTRIVVMKDGVIQQVDTPLNLYEHPENTFVATFLGSPQMNLLEGKVKIKDEKTYFASNDLEIELPEEELLQTGFLVDGSEIYLGIRPKDVHVADKGYKTKIEITEQLGSETILYVKFPGKKDYSTISISDTDRFYHNGEEIMVSFDTLKLHLFDKKTGESLKKANVCNIISSTLEEKDGTLYVGDKAVDPSFKEHILTDYRGEVELHVNSDSISLDEIGDSIALNVTVSKVVKYSTYSVVFGKLENNQSIIFKVNKEIKDKIIKVYLPLNSIEIHKKEAKIFSKLYHKDTKLIYAKYRKTKSSAVLELETNLPIKNTLFKVREKEIVNDRLILNLVGAKEVKKSGERYKESITVITEINDIFEGQFIFAKKVSLGDFVQNEIADTLACAVGAKRDNE